MGMNQKYKEQLIFFYWRKIVGDAIAAQAVPATVSFGTLTLTAKSSVWANNLMMMKLELIAKINMFIGDTVVKDIRFRGYSWEEGDKNIEKMPEGPNLGKFLRQMKLEQSEIQQAEQQCAGVQDTELRNQLTRLYKKNIKLRKLEEKYEWQPCQKCGVLCPPGEAYCAVCEREQRHETEAQIRGILADMPWARYADIYKYIPCTKDMVNRQRVKLLQKAAAEVDPDKPDSLEAKTLVMLYRCIPPPQLTAEIVEKTLQRLRNDLSQRYRFKKDTFKKSTSKYSPKPKK